MCADTLFCVIHTLLGNHIFAAHTFAINFR